MAEKKMRTLSIKVPEDMYNDLSDIAKENDRSQSAEGRRALQLHIQKHSQKKGLRNKN